MIKYLKKKRFLKDIKYFEQKLLSAIAVKFPDMLEQRSHYQMTMATKVGVKQNKIHVIHQTTDINYSRKNKKRHNKNFRIDGIEIFNKRIKAYQSFEFYVYDNLIQYINTPTKNFTVRYYDLNSIKIGKIKTSELVVLNPDKKILIKILKNLNKEQLELIDIENTFEIEVDDKMYYTIFDMEDGNYLAVDKSGKVFRLIHDHKQPIRKIFDDLLMLIENYKGNKVEFEKYFES